MQSQTLSKLVSALEQFRPYLYLAERPLTGLEWSPEPPLGCRPEKLGQYGGWQPIAVGGAWDGPDTTVWFRGSLPIPSEWAGQGVALKLRFGPYHDVWEPESLVYLNEQESQALDRYHHRLTLTSQASGDEVYRLAVEAYSGLDNTRPVLTECSLATINGPAHQFYFNLQAGVLAVQEIPADNLLHHELLNLLNEAYRVLDWSLPGSPAFQASLTEANRLLEAGFENLRTLNPARRPQTTITGHAHIDVAWLWPLSQTRRKAARTFSTVLKLMEDYPDYHFTQSQPQLYQFVKEDQPQLYRRIQERAAEGRWEPTGGMWVESDCNLTSGESLVRQFLYGQAFFQAEFGRRSRVLWLPDAFGFSPTLPQLMLGSGVDYFMTTKLSWNQFNRFPADTFWWEGLDGSRVLAHFVTSPTSDGEAWQTYNGSFTGAEVAGLWQSYRQKELNSELLYLYGWGDGGGGPTYEMLERAARWKDFPGLPSTAQGGAEPFFERLDARVGGAEELPRFYGELYMEYHQGTFTSQAWLKRANRHNEFALREAELYAGWAARPAQARPDPRLAAAWQKMLLNQFHDILPGSSIGPVYADARRDHAFIAQTAQTVREEALADLTRNIGGEGWAVFNSLGWTRHEPLLLPGLHNPGAGLVEAASGQILTTQPTEDGTLVAGLRIPSMGYAILKEDQLEAFSSAQLEVSLEPARLENQFLRVEFDRQGEISSIFDKEAGREVVAAGQTLNRLIAYEDRPRRFTAWNIEPYYREKATPLQELSRLEVVEEGPVRATLEIERKYLNSSIIQRISLWAGSRRLDFATRIDWHEHQIMLKALFPLNIHTDQATCEVAFGNYTRPTHPNTEWEQARYEVCAHKWVDLGEDDYGVSLLNDGKFGHSLERHTLGLTLLKSPDSPDPDADQGLHFFTYSLYPHRGDWRQAQTVRQAYGLNLGVQARPLTGGGAGATGEQGKATKAFSLLQNERPGVVLDTLKAAEDGEGLILRLYECHNGRGPERLTFAFPIDAAWECNLLEDKLHPLEPDGHSLNLTVRPYEVKTIRVILANQP